MSSLKELLDRLLLDNTSKTSPLEERVIEDLIGHHTGLSWGELKLKREHIISHDLLQTIERDLDALYSGEPLAYILGYKDFYKWRFQVSCKTLIPRPETELLVEKGLELLSNRSALVMDLGTGTGCIGLSLALERPQSRVYLLEKDPETLKVAQSNAQGLGATNVTLIEADVGQPVQELAGRKGQFDLIVANPPYIALGDPEVAVSVHSHEPHLALYSGEQGYASLYNWMTWAYDYLKPGGFYAFEFGKGQDSAIADFIASTDYSIIELVTDYSGIKRFFILKK